MASIAYYWAHTKSGTGGSERHENEGLGIISTSYSGDDNPKATVIQR